MKRTSQEILERTVLNTPQRCIFKSMGYTDDELSKPLIGIANTWSTICPGSYNLKELAEFVKKGIYANGGTAVEFGSIGPCDGVVDGDEGGRYTLPSRQILCDSIEAMVKASKLDALVLLSSCDKIVPAQLMAAARLDIPCIFLNGGPMLGGKEWNGKKSDQTTHDEMIGALTAGKGVSEEDIFAMEDVSMPTVGSCSFLGTANTMCCIGEALGMSLPGSALIPAVYAARLRMGYESGRAICDLTRAGITARQIITADSLRNAVRVTSAICGSTNAPIHLAAIAKEAGIEIDIMHEFADAYQKVPQIAMVNPAAKWDMEEFYKAGGIPKVMSHLGDLLHTGVMTVTGQTLGENLKKQQYPYEDVHHIIRTRADAYEPTGALQVLTGNLAPAGSITKPGAFDRSLYQFTGKARVYDGEETANAAILRGDIEDGDVIVIRYEGPKGGPGMREMYRSMKYLYGQGKGTTTALITDGRFSGTNNGCFVGHISPEAAEGGPIALIEDGDEIRIDVGNGTLELMVPDEILAERRSRWTPPRIHIPEGYLRLYARLAASPSDGAGILL